VGFTTGSRGKVPGKTCEKRRGNNNNYSSHLLICLTAAERPIKSKASLEVSLGKRVPNNRSILKF
jgi:hypothetical protein